MKLGILWHLRQIFLSLQLLTLYKGLIHPCMEYSSCVFLLDRMESKAFRFMNSSGLTDSLQPLSHCPNVASLSIFYCYFHANCSTDFANCMPPLLQSRCTSLSSSSHPSSVLLSNANVNQYSQTFIPFPGKLWNSLPASVFTSSL
ncbi:hypothetical protein E2C01_060893 [Portunus trituberculatus]|uniref:Uncharacterized protein n=1 Tax=Portunus trituberculatus TaxID=210409 RepID=A0A5B7H6P3_PORTR|nr:hypothetical protein [Portunus trituberculatus]